VEDSTDRETTIDGMRCRIKVPHGVIMAGRYSGRLIASNTSIPFLANSLGVLTKLDSH